MHKTILLWYRWNVTKEEFVFNHIEDLSAMSNGNLPMMCAHHPNMHKERWAKELALQIDTEIVYLNDPRVNEVLCDKIV